MRDMKKEDLLPIDVPSFYSLGLELRRRETQV